MDKSDKTPQHFKSLRAFLNALRDLNDLREIRREVDTELEIGAIIRRTHETYAPAPLFSNIRGHAGYQVVGAPLSYSSLPRSRMARVALALGLAPEIKPLEIIDALARATKRPPIPPVVVKEGACQQNVQLGEDVDLTMFPTPLIHAGDGGRYFNTLGFWVVRTPDGKWTNWSIARIAALKLSFDAGRTPVGPVMVLNCLLPADTKDLHISDFASNFPKDLQKRVLAHWDE